MCIVMSWRQNPEKGEQFICTTWSKRKRINSEEIVHQINDRHFHTTITGADWLKVSELLHQSLNKHLSVDYWEVPACKKQSQPPKKKNPQLLLETRQHLTPGQEPSTVQAQPVIRQNSQKMRKRTEDMHSKTTISCTMKNITCSREFSLWLWVWYKSTLPHELRLILHLIIWIFTFQGAQS